MTPRDRRLKLHSMTAGEQSQTYGRLQYWFLRNGWSKSSVACVADLIRRTMTEQQCNFIAFMQGCKAVDSLVKSVYLVQGLDNEAANEAVNDLWDRFMSADYNEDAAAAAEAADVVNEENERRD